MSNDKMSKSAGLVYTVLTANAEDPIKLLGGTDASSGKWIARASIQAAMGGVDFSKRFLASDMDKHLEVSVKKGESQGLLKDGRCCVFITAALALTIVNDKRYFKGKDDLKESIVGTIEVFVGNKAAPKEEPKAKKESEKIADKKAQEYAKEPESPADTGAATMKAVQEAVMTSQEFDKIVPPVVSELAGDCAMVFMNQVFTVAVLKTGEIRKGYVCFRAVCIGIGLDPDRSMMAVSNILNTGLAKDWGMDLVNIITVTGANSQKGPWINLDSIYSWLSTYELYMRRLDPKFSLAAEQKKVLDIFQSGLKEAALKLMKGLMAVAEEPKAAEAPKPPPFDKVKFLEQVKANKGTKVPSDVAKEPEVLDVKNVTMERVIEVANANYKANQEKIPGVNCESGPIKSVEEAAGVSEDVRKQLAVVPKSVEEFADDDDLFTQSRLPVFQNVERAAWKTVTFDGFAIAVLEVNDERWVSISRVCKDLGIDKGRQLKKLQGDPSFRCGHMSTPDGRNVLQTHICLTTSELFRWLDGIGQNKVDVRSSNLLAKYKAGLLKVLVDHEVQVREEAQVQAKMSPEIQALLDAVKQTNETARQMMMANQRLAIDSQETLEFAVDKTENLINQASAEVLKAREDAAEKKRLAEQKDAEANMANRAAFVANKAKDAAELTLNQVMQDYEPAIEKGKAFDELVYNGPSKNITTIAKECGLGSGTELNRLLEELGMIIKHRRYPNTWEPSAKMSRMVPIGTKLGCIESVGKGNDQTIPVFGHTTTVQCWAWMPAGELLIKRIVREYLEDVAKDAEEAIAKETDDLKEMPSSVPCGSPLQACPPAEPFPGKRKDSGSAQGELNITVSGGKMP